MKLFRVLVLGVALAAGGVAAYLALNLGPAAAPATTVVELAPQIETQDVLVANADLGQGQKLNAENIRWQRWPDEAINPGYIQKQARPDALEKLQGSVVRSQFIAGEPIREAKLANPGSGFLSAILPSGKRAIAVRVSAQNTAGGFILPNDRVDVVQTITQQSSSDAQPQTVSRTILTNVKVLAIDQSIDEQGGGSAEAEGEGEGGGNGESVVVGKTATLELDPRQVELITAAETAGTLSLSLRSFADVGEVAIATPPPAPPRPAATVRAQPAPVPPPKELGKVRIFRSGKVETLDLQ
jgi:pilus assembly protein CpaB